MHIGGSWSGCSASIGSSDGSNDCMTSCIASREKHGFQLLNFANFFRILSTKLLKSIHFDGFIQTIKGTVFETV